ncbi:MAG: hypothetical protein CVU86_06320 [Firmicutes bacterium HGW-Firmicutes-11]|nr:MAG: hypothetical protein CVU86_06320 [Firmicutes bacterium HGW-Firmicutes-11]
MKVFLVILGIVTSLSMLSTLVCGLWIKANKVTEVSSLNFHMNIGILSAVLTTAMAVAMIVLSVRKLA